VAAIPTSGASVESAVTIDEITLADDPHRWEALGFSVTDGGVQLGEVRLMFAGRDAGDGILGWSLRDADMCELDGLPTVHSNAQLPGVAPSHANGVVAIDHVVAMSPQLDRSVGMLRSAGLDLRRIREEPTPAGAPRQAFFRLGAVILEVVQEPKEILDKRPGDASGTARFWGLALLSNDLERTVAQLGKHVSETRPAVQPGRRIATLRRSAGLALPVALMSCAETPATRAETPTTS
jgi:hypothetical protein